MNPVPTYKEKLFIHPNGSSFKLLQVSLPNKESFYIEYPTNFDIKGSRLVLNKLKSGLIPNFVYKLEISGVGYKASKEGNLLNLNLGKSVPTTLEIPKNINVDVKKSGVEIEISGKWKEEVSLFASKILLLKPSHRDIYKQKGIKITQRG